MANRRGRRHKKSSGREGEHDTFEARKRRGRRIHRLDIFLALTHVLLIVGDILLRVQGI